MKFFILNRYFDLTMPIYIVCKAPKLILGHNIAYRHELFRTIIITHQFRKLTNHLQYFKYINQFYLIAIDPKVRFCTLVC